MTPIEFPEQNVVFAKPEGWTDEQCGNLPIWRGESEIDSEGTKATTLISCWALSKEDLARIQETGVVWLSIFGNGMPPVSVFTQNPFTK